MAKKPVQQFPFNDIIKLKNDEIESAYLIDQLQLNKAKIYKNREEYISTIPLNSKYMELGVAWGYYSELIAEQRSPKSIDLVDWYNQDFKCWSWRKFGECKCNPKHIKEYESDSHFEYINNKFKKYLNVNIIQGNVPDVLLKMDNDYDYIYVDITNDRKIIRDTLNILKNMVKPGGIIGLNDYLIYDGIIEDSAYGTYQSVNEFLLLNKDWIVDAIALHPLGFYDIYIRNLK